MKQGMKRYFIFMVMVVSNIAIANPTLKGQASELEAYLNGVPKIITLTTTVNQSVPLEKAAVKLLVRTEAPLLANALKQNLSLRKKVRSTLQAAGIKADNIKESKFSSTPEYGFFGDTPKSYTVENTLLVEVSTEVQMIGVAAIADDNKNIRYVSSKAANKNDRSIKQQLLTQALAAAKAKAATYAAAFNIKLVPVSFSESHYLPTVLEKQQSRRKVSLTSEYTSVQPSQFGESKYTLVINVNYKVYSATP